METLYGSEGYEVGAGAETGGHDFGTVGHYIDVGQCKCAGYFAEEGGLLVIRFDQREVDVRGPELQGKGGESRAGADVENARSSGGVGVPGKLRAGFRLRRANRFALGSASLRMTGV